MIGEVLLAHLVGDYILQSHWMATEKTKRLKPAVIHGVLYTLPFIFITQSWAALTIICVTHIIIDRYRLAKYVVYLKNKIAPKDKRNNELTATGFPSDTPIWLSTWLLIIVDNTIHLLINVIAILYF